MQSRNERITFRSLEYMDVLKKRILKLDIFSNEEGKKMSIRSSKKGLLIGFLIGGAVGGTIALLYAPQNGKRLRQDIGKKTGEIYESGRKIAADSWNGVKETAESTLESANDFLNSGMDKITRKAENVRDAFKAGMESYAEETKIDNGKDPAQFNSNKDTLGKIT